VRRLARGEAQSSGVEVLGADVGRVKSVNVLVPRPPTRGQTGISWLGVGRRSHARWGTGETGGDRGRSTCGPFTDHAVQDVTVEGAPGVYARIWLCARLAFTESVTSGNPERLAGGEASAWEDEGGTAA
jgi:hypothetical protein